MKLIEYGLIKKSHESIEGQFFDRLFASIKIIWLFFDIFSSFVRFVERDMRRMIKWTRNEGGRIYVNKSNHNGCWWDTHK